MVPVETIAPPPVPKSRGSQKAAGRVKSLKWCPLKDTPNHDRRNYEEVGAQKIVQTRHGM